jgi:hypothetical protein
MGTRLFPCAPLNKGIKESKTFTSSQWIRPCHEVLLSALVHCNPFSTSEMLQNQSVVICLSHWITPFYKVVPSAMVHSNILLTSEILTTSEPPFMLSYWIGPSQKVVSAAAVYQKSPRTSEMSIRAHAHARRYLTKSLLLQLKSNYHDDKWPKNTPCSVPGCTLPRDSYFTSRNFFRRPLNRFHLLENEQAQHYIGLITVPSASQNTPQT